MFNFFRFKKRKITCLCWSIDNDAVGLLFKNSVRDHFRKKFLISVYDRPHVCLCVVHVGNKTLVFLKKIKINEIKNFIEFFITTLSIRIMRENIEDKILKFFAIGVVHRMSFFLSTLQF